MLTDLDEALLEKAASQLGEDRVLTVVADVRDILQDAVMERTLWAAMRARHALGARGRPDAELAQTFFNSVTRRVFSTVGVDAAIEYLAPSPGPASPDGPPLYDRERVETIDGEVIRRILERFEWSVPYASLRRDASIVARIRGSSRSSPQPSATRRPPCRSVRVRITTNSSPPYRAATSEARTAFRISPATARSTSKATSRAGSARRVFSDLGERHFDGAFEL